jgi:hypothetical protein
MKFALNILAVLLIIGCVIYTYYIHTTNSYLTSENKKLSDSITIRDIEIRKLDTISKQLNIDKSNIVNEIIKIAHKSDSLKSELDKSAGVIKKSDNNIINIKNQKNEKINAINHWGFNNYSSFFTNYFNNSK